jgi:hypothetical protein
VVCRAAVSLRQRRAHVFMNQVVPAATIAAARGPAAISSCSGQGADVTKVWQHEVPMRRRNTLLAERCMVLPGYGRLRTWRKYHGLCLYTTRHDCQ